MHNELTVARVSFEIRFVSGGRISANLGPTLRGGLGVALRDTSCIFADGSCAQCPLARSCAYGYLFETTLMSSDTVMRRYPNAPHPFVLEPPQRTPDAAAAGSQTQFAVVLVGRAVEYVRQLFAAFEELGKKGIGRQHVPFAIRSVHSADGTVVYDESDGLFRDAASGVTLPLEPGQPKVKTFSLCFETPARIQSSESISQSPSLFDIVSSLCRRLYLLQHFHQPAAAAFSKRQNRAIPIGGLIGRLIFRADLGTLQPLLRAGEYIHIGKDTSMGLGKFRIIEEA